MQSSRSWGAQGLLFVSACMAEPIQWPIVHAQFQAHSEHITSDVCLMSRGVQLFELWLDSST